MQKKQTEKEKVIAQKKQLRKKTIRENNILFVGVFLVFLGAFSAHFGGIYLHQKDAVHATHPHQKQRINELVATSLHCVGMIRAL